METKNYKVPMEIIIEVSQLFKKFDIRAELNGGDDERGSVHLKVFVDPSSVVQQKACMYSNQSVLLSINNLGHFLF